MKHLDDQYYVEVTHHRYKNHPTENILVRLQDTPKSPRIQYQVQNETQIEKNQNVVEINNDELLVKICPKNKKQTIQQPKFKPPKCPSCKKNKWLEIDKGYYR